MLPRPTEPLGRSGADGCSTGASTDESRSSRGAQHRGSMGPSCQNVGSPRHLAHRLSLTIASRSAAVCSSGCRSRSQLCRQLLLQKEGSHRALELRRWKGSLRDKLALLRLHRSRRENASSSPGRNSDALLARQRFNKRGVDPRCDDVQGNFVSGRRPTPCPAAASSASTSSATSRDVRLARAARHRQWLPNPP